MIILVVLAQSVFCISMCEEPKICVELYNQGLNLFHTLQYVVKWYYLYFMALSVFFHKFQKEKIVEKQMKSLISIYFQHLIKQTFKVIRSIAKGSKFALSDMINYMGHRIEKNLEK